VVKPTIPGCFECVVLLSDIFLPQKTIGINLAAILCNREVDPKGLVGGEEWCPREGSSAEEKWIFCLKWRVLVNLEHF